MSLNSKTLREQRAKLIADARSIHGRAESDKRDMSGEESRSFDTMMADADKMMADIERIEKLESAERSLSATNGRQTDPSEPGRQPGQIGGPASAEYRSAYSRFLSDGQAALSPNEQRALQAEADPQGGYLVAPMQMAMELIKGLDNLVIIRQLATKFSVPNAQSLGVPALDADPADADWTSELQTGNEDSTMAFGKRELHPSPVAKRLKVSNKLLRLAANTETIVRERLTYKFAVTEEQAFMTGNGAGKPLGIFTAHDSGIPTSRDVATDNTSSAVTADGLINAKFALKSSYLASPNLRWVFHRDAIKQIRKLKDGNGVYMWQPSLSGGQPDRLLDTPVLMSEYAPNTFTTGLYVGIIGDFSHYWIADGQTLAIQRLMELYAETNQVGFIGRLECDGMPVLGEAFARVKLG